MNHHRVGKWQRRRTDTLASADDIRQRIQIAIEGEHGHWVERACARLALHPFAEDQHECGGAIARCHDAVEQRCGQARGEVFAGIRFAELVTQRVGQGAEHVDEFVDVVFGEGLTGQGEGLTGHGARVVEESSPEFAGFPPAVVAGVVAETEEDGERDADEGEGGGAEVDGDFQEVFVDGHRDDGDAEDQE